MCGIVGFIHEVPRPAQELLGAVESMSRTLQHRGPDDGGSWVDPEGAAALGFRRLAIQDLSDAGRQPMRSPSGRLIGVFNGEIYNFQELRRELPDISYRGGSDTEVLMHALETWGVRPTLARLNGMFAIGVWDTATRTLTLARDRMGIKPLYIARIGNSVAFASELRAFREFPGFEAILHRPAVSALLRYLYIPAPLTPLKGVTKLPPGCLMEISARQTASPAEAERWWTPDRPSDPGQVPTTDVEAVDRLEELLRDAVRMRLVADVPVGAFLSGGIDSSLVVALMQQCSDQPVQTFTIGFDTPAHDESARARAVARHLGTDHHHHQLGSSEALDLVPKLSDIFDEPLADPSCIPTFLVSRIARDAVTVALSGDGGDELFAGYTRHVKGLQLAGSLGRLPHRARRVAARALGSVPEGAWARLDSAAGTVPGIPRLPGQKAAKLARMLRASSPRSMYGELISTTLGLSRLMADGGQAEDDGIREWCQIEGDSPGLHDILRLDQTYYLPDDLLQKVDRASMASSLEVRVPLLDHRVVSMARNLPAHLLIREGRGKWLLREVLHRHVPPSLVDRPKMGFTVPVADWLRGPLRDWAGDLLLPHDSERESLLRPGEVEAVWNRFQTAGADEEAPGLWALAIFEQWRRTWDSSISRDTDQ